MRRAGKLFLVFLVSSILSATPSNSDQPDEVVRYAISNLVTELTEFSAFYALVSGGVDKYGKPLQTADAFAMLGAKTMSAADLFANEIGLIDGYVMKMIKGNLANMGEEINHDGANISVLRVQYGGKCKNIIENIEGRLNYWLNKETK